MPATCSRLAPDSAAESGRLDEAQDDEVHTYGRQPQRTWKSSRAHGGNGFWAHSTFAMVSECENVKTLSKTANV